MTQTVKFFEAQYVDPRSNTDKFYRVFVDGDQVLCQYGRNGTFGTFTPKKSHPDAAAAAKAADKAFAAKVSKGYNPTADGELTFDAEPSNDDLDAAAADFLAEVPGVIVAVREHAESAASTGLPTRPMLAEVLPPEQLDEVLSSDAWVAQPKLDGDRVVVEISDGAVRVLNRAGQPKVKNVGAAHTDPFVALPAGRWVIDGEVVGRKFWAFDLAASPSFVEGDMEFAGRHAALVAMFDMLGIDDSHESVGLIAVTAGPEAKRALVDDAKAAGKEGVMFRASAGQYEPGRRSLDLLKHKFTHTADVVVTSVGIGGKENVEVSVYNAEGVLQVVGRASTIGKGSFEEGDVVECLYLYVVDAEHPRMFQPRILRKRTDKSSTECSIEQFRHAVTDREVEA